MRTREGRRNRYEIRPDVLMRDPLLKDRRVGELLAALPVDLASCTGAGAVAGHTGSAPAIAAEPTVTP